MGRGLIIFLFALTINFTLCAQSMGGIYDSIPKDAFQSFDLLEFFHDFEDMDSVLSDFFSNFGGQVDRYNLPGYGHKDSADFYVHDLDFSEFIEQFLREDKASHAFLSSGSGLAIAHHSNNISSSTAIWIVEEVFKDIGHSRFAKITLSVEGVFVDNNLREISSIKYLKRITEMEGEFLSANENILIRIGEKI